MPDSVDKISADIAAAIQAQDPNRIELVLNSAFRVGLHPDIIAPLIQLAEMPWRTRHEDVVHALQQLRSSQAVEVLERTAHATHSYLDYDEFFGLARKCTWALADIGTTESREALQRLSQSSNVMIAGYAQKRLDRWQDELARKPEP